jgi:septum formation topological specificity factor MinE
VSVFYFKTRLNLVEMLGIRVHTVPELLEQIRQVPGSSIYHHTHRFLQQHNHLCPEPPNDFAFWITNALGLDGLGEHLASVDTIKFTKINDLRDAFIAIIEKYLQRKNGPAVNCHEGEEFHFMSSRTFIFSTDYQAADPREFMHALRTISINSLYYHIFESRLRLGRVGNDFSLWFESIGQSKLAAEIGKLDPYTITLEGLRKKIIQIVEKYAAN